MTDLYTRHRDVTRAVLKAAVAQVHSHLSDIDRLVDPDRPAVSRELRIERTALRTLAVDLSDALRDLDRADELAANEGALIVERSETEAN